MINTTRKGSWEKPVTVMNAIYSRRAVRDYIPQRLDQNTIRRLLDAAVHAPTAVHEEPWAFVVIQDKRILRRLSDSIKALLSSEINPIHQFTSSEFNAFYNAETLVLICGKPLGPFVVSDCWLAAENLMLAACSEGLGTCVIGLAVAALNTPEWKKEFRIPEEMTVYSPIIIGVPAVETPVVSRKPAQVLTWQ